MLNIRLIRGRQFLRGDQHGTLDLERSREALCQLLTEGTEGAGAEPGAHDLLFDVRDADIDMALKDVWILLKDLDECNPGFDGRLALLDNWDKTFDRMQFFEASSERIGVEAKAFLEFEEAVEWLWESRTISTAEDSEAENDP
jgi:hypothetical protein